MWLIGVSLALAALVAVLVGVRIWFNRMQDVRKPPGDDEAEQRRRAVTSSTIWTSGSGRF